LKNCSQDACYGGTKTRISSKVEPYFVDGLVANGRLERKLAGMTQEQRASFWVAAAQNYKVYPNYNLPAWVPLAYPMLEEWGGEGKDDTNRKMNCIKKEVGGRCCFCVQEKGLILE
jgi:hypothetical protein